MILNIAKKTQGDNEFYSRWEVIGQVFKHIPQLSQLAKIKILVVDFRRSITDDFLMLFPNLEVIASATTGHTHLKFNNDKIKLITLKGERDFLDGITSAAEHTIHLMFKLFKEVSNPPIKLSKKSIGLIGGYGRVATQVSRICKSLDMDVKIFDVEHNKYFMNSIIRGVDVFLIHLEENKDTIGLITREHIYSMKKTAFIINTARPSLIDENALELALENNVIAGAAIDSDDSILYGRNIRNLILTNHVGGQSFEDRISTDQFICDKVKDCFQSLPRKL